MLDWTNMAPSAARTSRPVSRQTRICQMTPSSLRATIAIARPRVALWRIGRECIRVRSNNERDGSGSCHAVRKSLFILKNVRGHAFWRLRTAVRALQSGHLTAQPRRL